MNNSNQDMTKADRLGLFAILLASYFALMMVTAIIGALLPFWYDEFDQINEIWVTILNSVFFLAYAVTALPQGALKDRIGRKKTLLFGLSLILAGSLVFALNPTFGFGLLSFFLIGSGVTSIQVVGNPLVKDLDPDESKYSRNLTLVQMFTGVGAATNGLLIGWLVGDGGHWSSVYFVFAGLAAVLLVATSLAKVPEVPASGGSDHTTQPNRGQDYLAMLRDRTMVLFGLGLFIYVGIEVGVANMIGDYLIHYHGASASLGAQFVSFYWLLQAIGRMTGGVVLDRIAPPRALVIYAACAIGCLLGAISMPTAFASGVMFVGVGFFTSIMFPTIFSLAIKSFDPARESIVSGVMTTAIVGGAVTTSLIKALGQETGSLKMALTSVGVASFAYIGYLGWQNLRWQSQVNSGPGGIDQEK